MHPVNREEGRPQIQGGHPSSWICYCFANVDIYTPSTINETFALVHSMVTTWLELRR